MITLTEKEKEWHKTILAKLREAERAIVDSESAGYQSSEKPMALIVVHPPLAGGTALIDALAAESNRDLQQVPSILAAKTNSDDAFTTTALPSKGFVDASYINTMATSSKVRPCYERPNNAVNITMRPWSNPVKCLETLAIMAFASFDNHELYEWARPDSLVDPQTAIDNLLTKFVDPQSTLTASKMLNHILRSAADIDAQLLLKSVEAGSSCVVDSSSGGLGANPVEAIEPLMQAAQKSGTHLHVVHINVPLDQVLERLKERPLELAQEEMTYIDRVVKTNPREDINEWMFKYPFFRHMIEWKGMGAKRRNKLIANEEVIARDIESIERVLPMLKTAAKERGVPLTLTTLGPDLKVDRKRSFSTGVEARSGSGFADRLRRGDGDNIGGDIIAR